MFLDTAKVKSKETVDRQYNGAIWTVCSDFVLRRAVCPWQINSSKFQFPHL